MAFRKILAADAPKRPRKIRPRFERTEEWRLMKACLEKGLNPNEALEVILTPEDKAKYRISSRRTVTRFLQKYLADNKMPYRVKSFHREQGDFFIVMHLPARR